MNPNEPLALYAAREFAAKHIKILVQETLDWQNGKAREVGLKTTTLEDLIRQAFPVMANSNIINLGQDFIKQAAFDAVVHRKA